MAEQAKKGESGGHSSRRCKLTCREFVALIGEFVGDELSKPRQRKFEQHENECAACSDYLGGYLKTVAGVRKLKQFDTRTEVPEDLVQAISRHARS